MSKRLQVLLDEEELVEIREVARRRRLSVAEWVRRAQEHRLPQHLGHHPHPPSSSPLATTLRQVFQGI